MLELDKLARLSHPGLTWAKEWLAGAGVDADIAQITVVSLHWLRVIAEAEAVVKEVKKHIQ
jgi:hypothetical protein